MPAPSLAVRRDQYRNRLEEWRHAEQPLVPFHWEIEFPEVFDREKPGFDAIVGNPPFGGKNTLASANAASFPDWLKEIHQGSHGNSDLVAHFFRSAFNLLRDGGNLGLIATNTIAQGDTRATGLRWICKHGGEIFAARKRYKWPSFVAVVVSILHIAKGAYTGRKFLDEQNVDTINAFLFHRGDHDDPARLTVNAGMSFIGSYVLGMGFTFDDTDPKGVATPLQEMRRLIATDPGNKDVIFPYVGGEEINASPIHTPHRYVINFGEMAESECRQRWPDLMAIVEAKVKPARQTQGSIVNPSRWWMFARPASGLVTAARGKDRVLVSSQVCAHLSFLFLPSATVFSHKLTIFPVVTYSAFCALQSRPHEALGTFF